MWITLALAACASFAAAESLYDTGMQARRRGDLPAARAAFEKLLAEDPGSGGALEGLSLVALAQGDYEGALVWLERWRSRGDSSYIESLEARAYARLGRERELTEALLAQGRLDPSDPRPLRRADDRLRSDEPGVFPKARAYKSLSQEGLETPSPQRIVYEGRSIGAEARAALRGGLSAIGGASARQEAQRNDTGGFTYYDILEQVYSLGLEGRARRGRWSAQYGQSELSDNKGAGVGRTSFSRVKAAAEARLGDATLRGYAERAPYFLRGAGGNNYFALVREDSARAEAEAYRYGWGFLARGAVYDYSTRTTLRTWSLLATKELGGAGLLQPSYSHSYQEFYGAGPDGRLAAMPYDRWGLRGRLGEEGDWQAGASFGHLIYRDGNRLNEGDADARLWLPRLAELSAAYRFHIAEYRAPAASYRSTDERGHWAGPIWRRRWGARSFWTQLAYEHGWLDDQARGGYEGNAWLGEVEWYRGRDFSLQAQGRIGNTSVRDQSYSAALQARWTF